MVAAVFARLLRMKNAAVGVMKPVTSGCSEVNGRLVSEDALLLCRAAGVDCSDDVAPYRLREPVAPAEAARHDGIRIDIAQIRSSYDRLAECHDYMIVEGAGGLMVPLAGGLLVADLIKDLALPVLVVARPDLGTVNHTVLTCYAAQQLGLTVAGVIINSFPDKPGLAEQSAPHLIGSLCGAPVLGVWPRCDRDNGQDTVAWLADWLASQAETAIVLRELGWKG